MKYFTPDFIQFFKELATNNHKEWFHSQKKRYEASVKTPFVQFVNDLITQVGKHQILSVEAKDCILRINRDIRFSKDKTPYNLHVTAFISPGGRKNKSIPGLFIRLSPEMIGIMGGCYGPDKDQLKAIREQIMADPEAFRKLLNTKAFKGKFGTLRGEQMKRIPKEWKAAAKLEPLLLHKQFYYMGEEKASLIPSDQLLKTVMDYYKAMKPLNDYLTKAINS